MDCAMQLAAFAVGCVPARLALGSGVPMCSVGMGAPTVHMRTCAHSIHAWFCANLDKYRLRAFKLGSPPDKKLVNPKMVH